MRAERTVVRKQFFMSYISSKTSRTKRFLLEDVLLRAVNDMFVLNLFILIIQLKKIASAEYV